MPLNGTTMGDDVAAAVQAVGITAGTPITNNQLKSVWEAACGAMVTHIKSDAVVTVTAVQAGSGTAPGTVS